MPEATETSNPDLPEEAPEVRQPAPKAPENYGGLLSKGRPEREDTPDLVEPPRQGRAMRSDASYRGEAIQLAKSIAAPDWDAQRLVSEATLIEMYLRGDESA